MVFLTGHRENTRKIPIHLFLSCTRVYARARVCRTFNYSPVKNFFFDEREKTKQSKKKTIRKRCFDGWVSIYIPIHPRPMGKEKDEWDDLSCVFSMPTLKIIHSDLYLIFFYFSNGMWLITIWKKGKCLGFFLKTIVKIEGENPSEISSAADSICKILDKVRNEYCFN